MEEKEKWARSLKAGDWVEDCTYEIHQIKEVHHNFDIPRRWAIILSYLPLFLWDPICFFLPKNYYIGTDLVLDNGRHCSAIHCCDPVQEV